MKKQKKHDRLILNKVKKQLQIRKDELILQQVYKQYGIEFTNTEDAVDYVLSLPDKI